MDNNNTSCTLFPTSDIIVVLATGKWYQLPFRVTLLYTSKPSAKPFTL